VRNASYEAPSQEGLGFFDVITDIFGDLLVYCMELVADGTDALVTYLLRDAGRLGSPARGRGGYALICCLRLRLVVRLTQARGHLRAVVRERLVLRVAE